MNDLVLAKILIDRLYRPQKDSVFTHKFFQDLCTGFSYTLGDKVNGNDFYYFHPTGCVAEKAFQNTYHYNLSYEIEDVIDNVIVSLLRYGKAYIYLETKYKRIVIDNHVKDKLSTLKLIELIGYPSRKNKESLIFYKRAFNGDVNKIELEADRFIELTVKDIGYRKNYFSKINKQIGKYDTTSSANEFIAESTAGYDFHEHLKHDRIKMLIATKDIGWNFETDELSDSYFFYRQIQQNKFKLLVINYIISKINSTLGRLLNDQNTGMIKLNLTSQNYSQLWVDYSKGQITGSELTKVLFHSTNHS